MALPIHGRESHWGDPGGHAQSHSVTSGSDHTFPGGTTNFLREDGTWAAAGGAHPNLATHDAMGLATDAELATHVAAGDPHSVYALDSDLATHAGAADPHTGYRLESAAHTHESAGLQAGQLDHGLALTGLLDDDHTQYQKESEKGAVNGYASLDGSGTIPDAQIPAAIARDSELHAQGHVLATGTALGADHSISGAAAGEVLRALGGTTAAFDVLGHGDLGSVTADQHHAESHQARHNNAGADALKLDDLAIPDDNTDLNVSTARHGLMSKLPGGTTTFYRADGAFVTPAGGAPAYTNVSKDLGVARRSGTFDITGLAGLTVDKSVVIFQSSSPITSKGNARDEPEMDLISATGYVVDASTIRVYWNAPGVVVGDYEFEYAVGG